jgi:hypothetical protein
VECRIIESHPLFWNLIPAGFRYKTTKPTCGSELFENILRLAEDIGLSKRDIYRIIQFFRY